MRYYRIWNEHVFFFIFGKDAFFVFENDTFLVLKMPAFRIWNGHLFIFTSGTLFVFEIGIFFLFENVTFRTLKLHILFFIIRRLRDKVTWEMSTFEMLTFDMSSLEGKAKQRKSEVKVLNKVSRFQIWGDEVIWEMPTLEMSSSEGEMTHSKNLRCSFQSFKVSRFNSLGDKVTWEISTFKICQNLRWSVLRKQLTAKSQILYVWQSSKYASEAGYKENKQSHILKLCWSVVVRWRR